MKEYLNMAYEANTQSETIATKCGFVAIIGAPNAGKSTLTNQMVGQKISIISHKVQTTRFPVKGIVMADNTQIIVVDTPGIFAPKKRLDRSMVASAWGGAKDADVIVHVIDAPSIYRAMNNANQKGDSYNYEDYQRISEALRESKKVKIIALNKIDEIDKPQLLELSQRCFEDVDYNHVVMISALKNSGVDSLVNIIAREMPIGAYLYPEDQASDIPLRLMAAEITREKVFERLHDELPYFSTVETDSWQERKDGSVRIDQTLYVSRENHKAIVIGKGGETLKWISRRAREDIIEELERVVHLFLHVKVKENWQETRAHYTERGLDFDA
jgi:GTPase